MNYQIETIPTFDRALRRLAKKYRRIKYDLLGLNWFHAEMGMPGGATANEKCIFRTNYIFGMARSCITAPKASS